MWSFPGDLCSTKLSSTLIRSCFWNATLRVPFAWDFWTSIFSGIDLKLRSWTAEEKHALVPQGDRKSWNAWWHLESSSAWGFFIQWYEMGQWWISKWSHGMRTLYKNNLGELFLEPIFESAVDVMIFCQIKVFEGKKHGRGVVKC